MAFLLHFKEIYNKNTKERLIFVFVLSFTRTIGVDSPTFLTHFHELQSVSFQMVPRTCISLLQGLSHRQLDLSMSFQAKIFKKGWILKTPECVYPSVSVLRTCPDNSYSPVIWQYRQHRVLGFKGHWLEDKAYQDWKGASVCVSQICYMILDSSWSKTTCLKLYISSESRLE